MTQHIFETLIGVDALRDCLNDAPRDCVVVDCRYDLGAPKAGLEAYLQAHIPGAVYADLSEDLSGAPRTDAGRHPLPGPADLEALFGRLGIQPGRQVIVYDAHDGAVAARLWWMLRYMGHIAVSVLDGGWEAWSAAGGASQAGEHHNTPAAFRGRPKAARLVLLDDVPSAGLLIDARAPARYRGEQEPIDPIGGHVPGAVNCFYGQNVDATGCWIAPSQLRANLLKTLGGVPAEDAVYYCGSGVTACQLILASQVAGLAEGRLYVGSWSEWCADAARPVATGAAPGKMPYAR